MDWDGAVRKHGEALKRILALLVAMAGLGPGEHAALVRRKGLRSGEAVGLVPAPTLPRRLHRAVLKLLRPAEAAVRRLIIVAARGLAASLPPPRSPKPNSRLRRRHGPAVQAGWLSARPPCLPLFDPLRVRRRRARRTAGGVPRISVPGLAAPFPIRPPTADDPVDATRLIWRLAALDAALDDLPGQARRFARWRARMAVRLNAPVRDVRGRLRFRRLSPLKPGRPPGWRRKPTHEVHEILDVLNGLAFWALEAPDTS